MLKKTRAKSLVFFLIKKITLLDTYINFDLKWWFACWKKWRWMPQNSPSPNRRHLILCRAWKSAEIFEKKKLLIWIFGAPKLQHRPKKFKKFWNFSPQFFGPSCCNLRPQKMHFKSFFQKSLAQYQMPPIWLWRSLSVRYPSPF